MPKTSSLESSDLRSRRRGRPIGKNRIPLSIEERRARNAQYERERRSETTEAMARLAEAAGCDVTISNAELLATVVAQLQKAAHLDPSDDIENLKRCNENLLQEIAELEQRLGWSGTDELEKENYQNNTMQTFKKRKHQRNNLKRRRELSSSEEFIEQQSFEKKLHTGNGESSPLKCL